jgi:hypothetical protein
VNERTFVKELGKKARRKFARCLAPDLSGDAAKVAQATVYQKHRSLQTRKGKYRG